jgi:hypothetical protein
VSNPWNEDFAPSTGAQNTLRWAQDMGASTLGEAYDMLEQFALSNDVRGIAFSRVASLTWDFAE